MPDKDTARLVVDDGEMNRDCSRRLVKQATVLIATGGRVLDIIRREPIDLVLLDVMMPRSTASKC